MSSSSSDEVEERLEEIFEEIVEDTYNEIVQSQTNKQRRRAYIERTVKQDTTVYGMTTSAKIRHSRHIYSDGVSA